MTLSDYLWFWKMSWDYMAGDRWRFWKGIIPATIQYRKDILKEMKNEPND